MENIMDEEDVEEYHTAKIQILRNDLAKAAQLRDEYKMQLNAANKEIEALKKSFGPKNDYKDAIVQELFTTHLWTKELEENPYKALHKIVCWHYDLGQYFQKQKTLVNRIKKFYYWHIYSAFWNFVNRYRYGRKDDKWPEF